MSVSLHSLSDSDILSRTRSLSVRERRLTLLLLLHLNEIERRNLHLKQGYSSMFDYCTSGLGYSEPSAFRRIRTARCVARFPEVYELLQANQVNLTTITRVARVLTPANKEALLTRVRGRSLREVDAIVAEYQPRPIPRDVVRPVVLRVRVQPDGPVPSLPLTAARVEDLVPNAVMPGYSAGLNTATSSDDTPAANTPCEKSAYFRREGVFHPTAPPDTVAPEKRIQFQFTTTHEFQQKLEKIKALAWHRLPANPSLAQVFELALDAYIKRHDPSARRERRDQRREKSNPKPKQSLSTPKRSGGQNSHGRSRYVAADVKDEVFTRDNHRCAFVSTDGRRCASKTALQVDHIEPFARGGASTIENLRLLCAYHNRLEAERLMGPHMRRG